MPVDVALLVVISFVIRPKIIQLHPSSEVASLFCTPVTSLLRRKWLSCRELRDTQPGR